MGLAVRSRFGTPSFRPTGSSERFSWLEPWRGTGGFPWLNYVIGCLSVSLLLPARLYGDDPHLERNPVFQSLLTDGLGAGPVTYKLPPARFSDEQSEQQRQELLSELVGDDLLPRFFRKSSVAPHIIKLSEQPETGTSRIRQAFFLFSVYAELDAVMQSDFFDRLGQAASEAESGTDDATSTARHVLTDPQLEVRQIVLAEGNDRREVYAFGQVRLLKRVDVAATTHSCWSKTSASVVAAFIVDPRFQQDQEFANRWWPLTRDDAGDLIQGEPQAYQGAGGYLRVTQMTQPRGCLIAEGYIAFVEPVGWFRGANLLASKLPVIVQTGIRRTRQSLAN